LPLSGGLTDQKASVFLWRKEFEAMEEKNALISMWLIVKTEKSFIKRNDFYYIFRTYIIWRVLDA
tara:strand:- start:427 stop:621 length:195 start_codon:yes stop_codon:yes gene_type:complete